MLADVPPWSDPTAPISVMTLRLRSGNGVRDAAPQPLMWRPGSYGAFAARAAAAPAGDLLYGPERVQARQCRIHQR